MRTVMTRNGVDSEYESLERSGGKPRRWEYVRMQIGANSIRDSDLAIEQLGREGWELVSTAYTQSHVHFWFKREVR
jgi:hypothetical protein